MKKLICLLLCAVLLAGLCACGSKSQGESVALPNPMHESTKDEIMQKSAIALDAPEGATDVKYYYIDTVSETGTMPVAQVNFTLDGKAYCYRAQITSFVNIMTTVDGKVNEDLPGTLEDCTNCGAFLSGMHYKWKSGAKTIVTNRDAVCGINDGQEGFIAWLDIVPGILYSLSVDKGASQELLMKTAEACFVPMQGECG